MLKDRIQKQFQHVLEKLAINSSLTLYPIEKAYLEKQQLIPKEVLGKTTDEYQLDRFSKIYIERCDKESEELIKQETADFLEQRIDYLKLHQNEFIYVESDWFTMLGMDAIIIELDDVFGTYSVLFEFKWKKKYESSLREQLSQRLSGDVHRFLLMYNQQDGVWDVNLTLDYFKEFSENSSFGIILQQIYLFMFDLVVALETELEETR